MNHYITANIAARFGISDLSGDVDAMINEIEKNLGLKGHGIHATEVGPISVKSERAWIGLADGGNNWTKKTCYCTVKFSDESSETYSFLVTCKPDNNPDHISDIIGLGMPKVFVNEYLRGRTKSDIKFIIDEINKKLNSLVASLASEIEHNEKIAAAEKELEEAQQKLKRLKCEAHGC